MGVTRSWDGFERWTGLSTRDGVLLAQGHVGEEAGYAGRARAFDAATLEPLGPAFDVEGAACLASLVGLRSAPVVVHAVPGALMLLDPRTGSPLRRVPLRGREGWRGDPTGLVVGAVGGRSTVFVLDEEPGNEHAWWAVDLDTGAAVPGLGDGFRAHHLTRERLVLAGGYLIVPVQRVRVDDFLMDEVEDACRRVYRSSDGRRIAEIECDGGEETVAAVVGGRPLMVVSGRVYALPGLEPVADLGRVPGRTVSDLTEWAGLPVAVFAQEGGGHLTGGDRPFRLFFRFLDGPDRPTVEIPWTGAHGLHDMVATADGTVVVSTVEGVHALRVDL